MRRIVLALALLLAACGGDDDSVAMRSSALELEAAPADAPADLAPADPDVFLGLIEPRVIERVSFEVPGKVSAVHVQIGDEVRKGQVLGELATDDRLGRLEETRRRLRDAQAARPGASRSTPDERPPDWMLDEADRLKVEADAVLARTRWERGDFQATAKREGERAATERAIAMAAARGVRKPSTASSRRAAEDSLALALQDDLAQRVAQLQFAIENSRLESPIAGQVVNVTVFPGGDWNTRSVEAAFEVVDPGSFVVQVVVPEDRARALAADAEVTVELPALGNATAATLPARLVEVGEEGVSLGGGTRFVPVTFKLPSNPPRPLLMGEEVEVRLP